MNVADKIIGLALTHLEDIFSDCILSDSSKIEGFERHIGIDVASGRILLTGLLLKYLTVPVLPVSGGSKPVEHASPPDSITRVATIPAYARGGSKPAHGATPSDSDTPIVATIPVSPVQRKAKGLTLPPAAGVVSIEELTRLLEAGETLAPEQRVLLQRKRCTKCGNVKDFSEFWKSNAQPDGKQSRCKACANPQFVSNGIYRTKKERQRPQARTATPALVSTGPDPDIDLDDAPGTAGIDPDPDSGPDEDGAADPEDEFPEEDNLGIDDGLVVSGKDDDDDAEFMRPRRPVVIRTPRDSRQNGDKLVYSKLYSCPKCGAGGVRLQRSATADKAKDSWTHVRPGLTPCQAKISHYQIKDDPKWSAANA